METFFTFVAKRVDDCSSLLCVGLDPHINDLPHPTAEAALEYCVNLVRKTARYAAAFKPNAAFFEVFGAPGWAALKELVSAIQDESDRMGSRIPVILDAKRGDIASTAQAYAHSAFKLLGVDAITLNPYLGRDSLEPFLSVPERGVFLLCKTSNPGSADLQDLPVSGGTLYEHVARLAQEWNTANNIGLVVGATQMQALQRVRQIAPDLWFLVPGVGAQGGDLESVLASGQRQDGSGLLINVSRSIAHSANPALAAAELRDRMVEFRLPHEKPYSSVSSDRTLDNHRAALADQLLDIGCVKFGDFTLKSGLSSPIYLDLRILVSHPQVLAQVAQAYKKILQQLKFERMAALPYAALPIATAISLQNGWAFLYPRKESKEYGTRADIEGLFSPGEQVVVIDDLATTGGSKFEAIGKLTAAGLLVQDIVVLIDRQSGAQEALAQAGFRLHAVMTLKEMLDHWETHQRVPSEQIDAARSFLAKN
jgi:uridine monophosphate synthetase